MVDDNGIKHAGTYNDPGAPLKGIYSTVEQTSLGAGMTRRVSQRKRYWAVWEPAPGEDTYTVQSLNQNLIPTGSKRSVSSLEFRERFRLEPDFFVDVNAENVRHLWEQHSEKRGAEHESGERRTIFDREERPRRRERGEPPRGTERDEPLLDEEIDRAPLDREQLRAIEAERNARAGYGLGMSHLKRGNMDKAKELLKRVAVEEGDYVHEHKHMFNEFGVGLRKNQLLDIALLHMRRALSLAPYDENIYHNMARLYYEKGDKAMAVKHLEKSLELNPEFKESRQFLDFINKRRSKRKKKLRFKI
ncbi:MAG: tetratricopeptide repeat protein [Oceanidesulfovibrio sp.]